ncbi:MAG: ATP synthase F1 subunit delta [Acidimicrobiaceae bacterium]|nr:ATP synthase F1 subunit delta [Acidimicrobiaceae bacterium]
MRESLRGYAQGILYLASQSGKYNQVIGELASFNALLDPQEMLAEVISDPSIPAKKRQAILGDLLAAKVDVLTVRLLEACVGTENPRSIVDCIADLVRLISGDDVLALDGGFATSGRIAGYSQALLESLSALAELEVVEEELFRFARIVESNTRLRRVLSGIGSEADQRKSLVAVLLRGKCHPLTLRIAEFAASTDRIRDFVEVLDSVVTRAAELRSRKVAMVQSATELTQDQVDQISAALSRAVGSEVEMRTSVDPSLVGGVVAVIGDTVFDGSVRTRIEQLRVRLGLPATVKSRERN